MTSTRDEPRSFFEKSLTIGKSSRRNYFLLWFWCRGWCRSRGDGGWFLCGSSGEFFDDKELLVYLDITGIKIADSIGIDTFFEVPKLLIGKIIPCSNIGRK